MKRAVLWVAVLVAIVVAARFLAMGSLFETRDEAARTAHRDEIDNWHARRIERLRSDTGWLTLVGLHPLAEGEHTIGAAPDRAIRLTDAAPARTGTLVVGGDGIVFRSDPGAAVTLAGTEPAVRVTEVRLETDVGGSPTVLAAGTLVFHVIDRQGELFLRVKDRASPLLASFEGIERYPVDRDFRVVARIEGEPGTVTVPNVLGQSTVEPTPGTLVFELDGREHRLTPTGTAADGMFVIFGDATNADGTYPGGRFLSIDPAGALGTVVIDFNKAYNPPCAFTPYATCPLPSRGNMLDAAITAGEKVWGEGH